MPPTRRWRAVMLRDPTGFLSGHARRKFVEVYKTTHRRSLTRWIERCGVYAIGPISSLPREPRSPSVAPRGPRRSLKRQAGDHTCSRSCFLTVAGWP